MAAAKPAIIVRHVSKNFALPHEKTTTLKGAFVSRFKRQRTIQTQHALRDISFEVNKGEFFGIVGRNGSGKSTLLKLLAGIYQPSSGTMSVLGKLVPFIELGVGFNPELTGRENVYLNGALLGFAKRQVDAMYQEIVEFAELEVFMDQKLKNYSSGMQVRLAFSLAARAKADILLIDEVLAVGDADFQRKCFSYFRQLKKNDTTVIFISHDMSAIREYCDRVILVDDTRIIAEGDAETIAEQYNQLFVEQAAQAVSEPGSRWGDGDMAIERVNVTLEKGRYTLAVVVRANREVTAPVFGFVIKTAAGKPVFGSNTKLAHLKTQTVKAQATCTVIWQFDDLFNDGQHMVTIAAQHTDGIGVYDWWDEATTFVAVKNDPTPYLVLPAITTAFTAH